MDLAYLRPLYTRSGPWASVYIDTSHDPTEDSARIVRLRWDHLRRDLHEAGADERTMDAIWAEIQSGKDDPERLGVAVLANGGEVVVAEHLTEPLPQEEARWSPLPHAMRLVAQLGERVPWLRVVIDRSGASLTSVTAGDQPRTSNVRGSEVFPPRKSRPGGMSSSRLQRAAEVHWDRNAADIAGSVTEAAERIGAEVVVLAGDVRARQLLRDRLPERVRDLVVEVDGGSRGAWAPTDPLDEATAEAITRHATERVSTVVDKFAANDGRDGVTGFADVIGVLRQALVDTLLLVDDPSAKETLWIGPEPTDLAMTPQELIESGVPEPIEERADAAILRALAATGAELVLVEEGAVQLSSGMGAIVRY